jgi:hypothetical protein
VTSAYYRFRYVLSHRILTKLLRKENARRVTSVSRIISSDEVVLRTRKTQARPLVQ